ncbi:hypothetical protein CY34DRAFT_799342 [Suillus luteus UH-Slu-Lm8-n1]|uniref:Uncharacterized protein n=1 Tax=Suillus luteus UH-Slu-Lm8-n1 TaxID=930992 RepID=A0A0D0BNQ1_9AGAM|nr:hypothetical protein CY34DRAFT_799342 [Suillus luteus UH-Slu-Lm8-n1]
MSLKSSQVVVISLMQKHRVFPANLRVVEAARHLSLNLSPHGDTIHDNPHDNLRLKVVMDPAFIDIHLSLPTSPERYNIDVQWVKSFHIPLEH